MEAKKSGGKKKTKIKTTKIIRDKYIDIYKYIESKKV